MRDGALDAYETVLKFEGAVVLGDAAFLDGALAKVDAATNNADVIWGSDGFDTIYGLGGADLLHGAGGAVYKADFVFGGQ